MKKSYCLKTVQVANILWMTTPDFCHKTKHIDFLVSGSCSILDLSVGGNLEIVNSFHLLQRETDVSKSSSQPNLLIEQNSSMLKCVCPQSSVKMSNCTLEAVFSRSIPHRLRDVKKEASVRMRPFRPSPWNSEGYLFRVYPSRNVWIRVGLRQNVLSLYATGRRV